jgi:hypothetical protein
MKHIHGSCLCGAITFKCQNSFTEFHFCHCTQCQKTSGSAHVANLFTSPDNIEWLSGKERIIRYDVPGRTISTAFCGTCGSPVPYLSLNGDDLLVPAGCLDGEPNYLEQDNIFWHEKASWYEPGVNSKKYLRFPE